MIRLAISVEGQTEEEFSKDLLTAHLQAQGVEAQPILLGRAHGHAAGGGNVTRMMQKPRHVHLLRWRSDLLEHAEILHDPKPIPRVA